jgi:hypothetical protein
LKQWFSVGNYFKSSKGESDKRSSSRHNDDRALLCLAMGSRFIRLLIANLSRFHPQLKDNYA